ncbi:hypothetical protein ACFC18_45470 [Streptomyces sp. NPDC056121]
MSTLDTAPGGTGVARRRAGRAGLYVLLVLVAAVTAGPCTGWSPPP